MGRFSDVKHVVNIKSCKQILRGTKASVCEITETLKYDCEYWILNEMDTK
jgi:hypothetical protein